MNKSIIRYLLCRVVQFEGIFLMLPSIVSVFYKEKTGIYFALTALACLILGTIGTFFKPKSKVFYAKEGYVTVALSWILLSLIGAVPFTVSGEIPNYVDALFETASGFTTTGASILTDVETLSQTAMFFRCFTNWIGGMGVIVFIMAVVPLSGSYNLHLMRAESTGTDVGKLVPKIKESAKILYGMYLGLSVVLIISFLIAGLSIYDALILSFSTMGTGGFANLNASLGGYSYSVQVIAIIFMFLCGINFNAYFYVLKRKPGEVFKIEEVRYYIMITACAALAIALVIKDSFGSFKEALHHSLFQVVSIMTTTGFSTTDFDLWPSLAKAILVLVMLIGGCAGSTSGGIKVSRVLISIRALGKEVSHLTHPRIIKKVRNNSRPISDEVVKNVQAFIAAFFLMIVVSSLIISKDNLDLTSNLTAVISMVSNVGPGLGKVGPTGNFAMYSPISKIVLIFDMLAGRLEIFPMLVLFYVRTWRKN